MIIQRPPSLPSLLFYLPSEHYPHLHSKTWVTGIKASSQEGRKDHECPWLKQDRDQEVAHITSAHFAVLRTDDAYYPGQAARVAGECLYNQVMCLATTFLLRKKECIFMKTSSLFFKGTL